MNRMILTGKPFVSDYLKETIKKNRFRVIDTPGARELVGTDDVNFIGEDEAAAICCREGDNLIYTVSESALEWIGSKLAGTDLSSRLDLFKDKKKFRDLTSALYPDLFYREAQLGELDDLNISELPVPAVIKPAVGFFSLGVRTVNRREDWKGALTQIKNQAAAHGEYYPDRILDTSRFIIEGYIEGEEYAMDVYADREGSAVVVGILKHLFGSEEDVSDRVYITSGEIIRDRLDLFTDFADRIIELAGLRNFPFHAEVRIDRDGRPIPIEINPLRFGAWCTTADLTGMAFGGNPYEQYFHQEKPDWESLLTGDEGKIYSLVALNNTTGFSGGRIKEFDYDKLASHFEKPLEIRKWDYRKNPLFGFMLTETAGDNIQELESILRSDLSEFVIPAD